MGYIERISCTIAESLYIAIHGSNSGGRLWTTDTWEASEIDIPVCNHSRVIRGELRMHALIPEDDGLQRL